MVRDVTDPVTAKLARPVWMRWSRPYQAEAAESTGVAVDSVAFLKKEKFGTVCSNPLFENGPLNRRGSVCLVAISLHSSQSSQDL